MEQTCVYSNTLDGLEYDFLNDGSGGDTQDAYSMNGDADFTSPGQWMTIQSLPGKSSSVLVHYCPGMADLELVRIHIVKGTPMREFVSKIPGVDDSDASVVHLSEEDAMTLLRIFNAHFEKRALELMAAASSSSETATAAGKAAKAPSSSPLSGTKRKRDAPPTPAFRHISEAYNWLRRTIGPQAGSVVRVGSASSTAVGSGSSVQMGGDGLGGKEFALGANGLAFVVLRGSAATFAPHKVGMPCGLGSGPGGWNNDYFELSTNTTSKSPTNMPSSPSSVAGGSPVSTSVMRVHDKVILQAAIVRVNRGHRLKDGTEIRKPGIRTPDMPMRSLPASTSHMEVASSQWQMPSSVSFSSWPNMSAAVQAPAVDATRLAAARNFFFKPAATAPIPKRELPASAASVMPMQSMMGPTGPSSDSFWLLVQPQAVIYHPEGLLLPHNYLAGAMRAPYFATGSSSSRMQEPVVSVVAAAASSTQAQQYGAADFSSMVQSDLLADGNNGDATSFHAMFGTL